MRFYRIDLSRTDGATVYLRSLNGQTLTSLAANGITNPGALTIELDIPVNPFSTGDATSAYVKVWGVGLQDILRASDYNGMNVTVYGGMAKGLPLADPRQQGLLIQGTIFQSYGNWVGTEQSIVFIVGPATGSPADPGNFPFTWQAGQPLSTALSNTLNIAFPDTQKVISISPDLVIGYTETGHYQSLKQFSEWLNARTQPIIGGNYQGVQIANKGNVIVAWDGTQAPAAITAINPWDLIGQPTWQGPNMMTFQTAMRGNVNLGDVVTLPQTIVQQTQASLLRFQDRTSFNGRYRVTKAQHFGSYRQPDAASWNTTFWVTPDLT